MTTTKTPRLSVAPMVGITTAPHRYLCRLLSSHVTLYTEMVVDDVLFHARPRVVEELLLPGCEGDVVLQVASSHPSKFAQACEIAERVGYKEVNLNCGCPAPSAKKHQHGAILMRQPEVVGAMVREAVNRTKLNITVKCRLGVDEFDSYHHVKEFVRHVIDGGASRLVIHARKGILRGLHTRANRSVPPLQYEWVTRLCGDFPHIPFELNGGVMNVAMAKTHVQEHPQLAGVMLGRAIMRNPLLLVGVDKEWYGDENSITKLQTTRRVIFDQYFEKFDYGENIPGGGNGLRNRGIARLLEPVIGMFANTACNHKFRALLHEARSYASPVKFVLTRLEEDDDLMEAYDAPLSYVQTSSMVGLCDDDDSCNMLTGAVCG